MRCGDTVRLEGTDYDMEVAYADHEGGYFSWCGWPNGNASIARAKLVTPCSDEEHREAVARWLDRQTSGSYVDDSDDRRRAIARIYRPRAYWRAVLERELIRLDEQRNNVASIEAKLAKAETGLEDA